MEQNRFSLAGRRAGHSARRRALLSAATAFVLVIAGLTVTQVAAAPAAYAAGDGQVDPAFSGEGGQTDPAAATDPASSTDPTATDPAQTDPAAPTGPTNNGVTFDPGNLISDAVFYNGAGMTASEIQTFLTEHGADCSPGSNPCLKDFTQATPTRAETSYCKAYLGSPSESAADIIAKVGVACSINPQVLLVMLQKEQGLVDASRTSSYMYRSAMGYGCPDTAECDSTYYGFFNQVYAAAAQFEHYTQTSTSWSYRPGWYNTILYSPDRSCGTSQVFIQNQATANLYIYTPYRPNDAALSNLRGIGDGCSAYGNRNFWVYFTTWFGDPTMTVGLQSPSFEGALTGWGPGNGFVNRAIYEDQSVAEDGSWYLAANTAVVGRSIAQEVWHQTVAGDAATATVWLRSSTPDPFTGALVLRGTGGVTETSTVPFTVGDTWTPVSVQLPVAEASHVSDQLVIVMTTTTTTLYIDNASIEWGSATPIQNILAAPGFEGGADGWMKGDEGFVNNTVYQDPSTAHSGSWYGATNTSVPGRSLVQQVAVVPAAGSTYTFSTWVRSADPGEAVSLRFSLSAIGDGPAATSTATFASSGTWRRASVSLDIPESGIIGLRASITLLTAGVTLDVDDAVLAPNLLTAGSFENGSFENWNASEGNINQAVYDSTVVGIAPHNGSWFAASNVAQPGGAIWQTVARQTFAGDSYTAEIWLRSSDPEPYFTGTLTLSALGGDATESASTDFTVDSTWSRIRVVLPITQLGHTTLQFAVVENTVGATLFMDGAQLY